MALGIALADHRRRRRARASRSSSSSTIGIGRLFGQIPWLVLIVARGRARLRAGPRPDAVRPLHVRDRLQPEAARRAGINVDRHLIKVYALAGTLAGLAGVHDRWRASARPRSAATPPTTSTRSPAVVIGGTSLFGGIGTILGTVIGVFIPAVLQNGFVIIGVEPFWQQVAVGAVLIVAVYLDQLRRSQGAAVTAHDHRRRSA